VIIDLNDIQDEELKYLIQLFLIENAELADSEEADGKCVDTTLEFYYFLEKHGVDKNRFDWDGSAAGWWWEKDTSNYRKKNCSYPPPHDYYYNNGWPGHRCAWVRFSEVEFREDNDNLVKGYYIDFTARQYGEDIPFPLIWKDK
jgi:hypothetical protein